MADICLNLAKGNQMNKFHYWIGENLASTDTNESFT